MPVPTPTNLPPLASLCPLLDRLSEARIVVWGDVVADCFLYGTTTRISREAPALVVRKEDEEIRPGGAGNSMMNSAALGARVTAVGYLGADRAGRKLRETLEASGVRTDHLVERDDAPTPIKTRVMAGGVHTVRQQILRIDSDPPWPHDDDAAEHLGEALAKSLEDADALLVSDYAMGGVSPAALAALAADLAARGTLVAVDSRCELLAYRGANVVTPNEEEVEAALGLDDGTLDEAIDAAGPRLLAELGCDAVLITRGSRGMALFERDSTPTGLPIHGTDEIADVTGAGDAVISALTTSLVAGASMLEAARISNVAASLAVMKRGTATVSAAELRAALEASA